MPLFLPILYGSVRDDRQSFGLARYACQCLSERKGVSTRLYDPRDLPFGNLLRRSWEMSPIPPTVAAFATEMERADGFVLVTPEYNYSFPGALKNLLDHFFSEWNRKPFGLVVAGGIAGGIRAADQLRQVIAGLNAIVIPTHVSVPYVEKVFDSEGPRKEAERWKKRFHHFFGELEWYAYALQQARRKSSGEGRKRHAQ